MAGHYVTVSRPPLASKLEAPGIGVGGLCGRPAFRGMPKWVAMVPRSPSSASTSRTAGRGGSSGPRHKAPGQDPIRVRLARIHAGQKAKPCHDQGFAAEERDRGTFMTRFGALRYVQRRLDTGVPAIGSEL